MAFGFFSALGAIGKIAGLVKYVMQQLKLAGAYVSGWMRAQRVHQEAAEEHLQDVEDDVEESKDKSRDELIDSLADDDGVRDTEGVPGDTKAGDRSRH